MNAESSAPDRTFEVVGFAGSLRRASYNRALLRAAVELAPPDLHIVVHDLSPIPLYNADVEAAGVPSTVTELRAAVQQADGLLIATPEYNHGVPGILKNTIDEALLAVPGELEKRTAEQTAAAVRRKEGAAGSAIAGGDATPDVVAALQEINRLLNSNLDDQTGARTRLKALIESLQPKPAQ